MVVWLLSIAIRANNTFLIIVSNKGKVIYSQSLGKINKKKYRGLNLEILNSFFSNSTILKLLQLSNIRLFLRIEGLLKHSLLFQFLNFIMKLKLNVIMIYYISKSKHT